MSDIVRKIKHENQIAVYFPIEADEVMAIGEKMVAINEEAYMNGYNWDAFLKSYLDAHHPELLNGLETDPEAGTYMALYAREETHKADKLIAIIKELISNPEKVYQFLEEQGEEIEWD